MNLSSPSNDVLAAWRAFLETGLAVTDVLDRELRERADLSLRRYDVLVHAEEGVPMTVLAEAMLTSKSGLTRVVDNLVAAGLVTRVRPEGDRRVVLVELTTAGRERLDAARAVHRDGIARHFGDHVPQDQLRVLVDAIAGVRAHARSLRPGTVSDG